MGGDRYCWIRTEPVKDAEGRCETAMIIAEDITERKAAEEALRLSEAQYRAIVEATAEMISRFRPDMTLTYVNDVCCRFTGLRAEELVGKSFLTFLGPEDRQHMLDDLAQIGPDRPTSQNEQPLVRADGEVRWVSWINRGVFDSQGRVVEYQGVGRDVTAERMAQEALRQSEEKYRAVVETIGEAIFVVDGNGVFRFMNGTAAERLGGRPEDFIGRKLTDVFPPELARQHRDQLREVIQSGQGVIIEARTQLQGQERYYRVSLQPLRDAAGQVTGVLGLGTDITERAAAAQAVAESEARFRDLFENAPLCIFEGDVSQDPPVIRRANRHVAEVYGWSAEEVASMPVERLIPREAMKQAGEVFALLKEKGFVALEMLNVRRDGTVFPVRVVARVSTAFGPRRVIVMIEDITEQKRTERALRDSETRYRALVERSPAITYITALDPTSTTTYVSPQVREYLGYTPEDYQANPEIWHERLHPADRAWVVERLGNALSATGRFQADYRMLRRDGRLVWFRDQAAVIHDENGTPLFLQGVMFEITAWKQAEEDLRISRERLQYVIDNSSDTIFRIDLQGNYILANKAGERLTGYPLERLLKMNMRELVTPEYRAALAQRLADRIAGKELKGPFIFDIVHRDGRRLTVELTTSPVHEDGRLVAVQGIARDITERRRAEEQLQAVHRQIDQAREEERKRLSRELHDSVGQGLVALQLGVSGLLKESQGFPKTMGTPPRCIAAGTPVRPRKPTPPGLRLHRAFTQTLGRMSEQCDGLIREVRSISRGLYPATLESLGLASALKQVANDFRVPGEVASGPGLKARSTARAASARFPAEIEIVLFRVAQEAITNAVRHACASRIQVGLDYVGGEAVLKVCDDGTGFEVQERSTAGLGLTTMRERVQSVGGRLEVGPGRGGTCLIVRVPTKRLRTAAGTRNTK